MSKRLTGDFDLEPLTRDETTDYLHAKLRAGGCIDPMMVLPEDVCIDLYLASGGWPGILDRLMLLALANADRCPIRTDHVQRPLIPNGTPSLVEETNDLNLDDNFDANGAAVARQPKLFLTYNGRSLREIDIDRPRLLIGRSDHNDLCVNSRYISRHHALFIRRGRTTFLMDLNSTNGTYVNGKLIKKHALQNGDVITVGHHQLKFGDDDVTEADQDDFEKTMVIHPSSQSEDVIRNVNVAVDEVAAAVPVTGKPIPMPSEDHSSTQTPEAAPATALPKARIQVLSGQFAGREMELTKALTTLGRPGIQVAAITRRAEGYFIVNVDPGTKGYPKVNEESIGPKARQLKDNDVVELAGVKMGFFIE
ncbi:MAG: FHA domain-containing protein [Proteobacteria bacterium]|nr:FHA domain-containing protein [Pseudomonadota bacterium]